MTTIACSTSWGWTAAKSQIPRSKSQIPSPNVGIWRLGLGFGIWDLVMIQRDEMLRIFLDAGWTFFERPVPEP